MTSQELATKLKARLRHALPDAERYEVWAEPKKGDYRQIEIRVSDRRTGDHVPAERSANSLRSDSEINTFVAELVGDIKKSGD